MYCPSPASLLSQKIVTALQSNQEPATEHEAKLLDLLRTADVQLQSQKSLTLDMQVVSVLQNIYVQRVYQQLQGWEEKQNKLRRRKLMTDGLPRLLTGDVFFTQVTEFEDSQRQKQMEKEVRKQEREQYIKEMEEWKQEENAWKVWVAA
ncbi:hypothetical protein C8Q80DRAFT_1109554 [Daedaleopsis nitida]|nr:hypothetical protein C8Q80DRAFT_1109554 [Daedaleopsis nitida]